MSRRRAVTIRTIRPDYRLNTVTRWTYAEAGDRIGRGWEAIRSHRKKPVRDNKGALRHRWRLADVARGCPFKVDRTSFVNYIATGEPQGELAE